MYRKVCIHVHEILYTCSSERYMYTDFPGHVYSKQGQANNKAKQHSTPKAVTFPKKNELRNQHLSTSVLSHLPDIYMK